MISPEVLKKIRLIEIRTKRFLNSTLVGDSRTAQKGFGLEFDQLREYSAGDDIRFIDWKATARSQKFLVRQYFEERNRKIMLMVDVSGSSFYGSGTQRKYDQMAQIASILALVSDFAKDAVGLVLFAGEIREIIPPATGRKHVRFIMEKLFSCQPNEQSTGLAKACEWAARTGSRSMLTIMISDFIAQEYEKPLRTAARKNETIAIRCLDPLERAMPSVELLNLQALESDASCTLSATGRAMVNALLHKRLREQEHIFKKAGVDLLDITCGQPVMKEIVNFFKRRMMY